MRLARIIARYGLCSRREAERWITAGRVRVNGHWVDSPASTASPDDRIEVDGHPLRNKPPSRLWRYHKPPGFLTTSYDDHGRPTIFDQLGIDHHLMPVGRLDANSEGLLLLTNDGTWARQLELPANNWQRRYRVRVYGSVDRQRLADLRHGISIDGIDYGRIDARVAQSRPETDRSRTNRSLPTNTWVDINLYEGKNRTIRKVMGHLGLEVNRLIRVGFGHFTLGGLERGQIQAVSHDQAELYLTTD